MLILGNCEFRPRAAKAPTPQNCIGRSRSSGVRRIGCRRRGSTKDQGSDGVLMLYNGVTRATRIAKLAPGTMIQVEVIGKLPRAFAGEPKIGDLLP
jgi:hypothetical protein